MPITRSFAVAATLAAVLLTACGSTATSSPAAGDLLTKQETTVVGEPIAYPTQTPAQVTSSIIVLQPGEHTTLHSHTVPLYAYVLEGELTVDYATGVTKTYPTGTAFMEAINTEHEGHNDGDIPVKLVAVYIGAAGVPNSEVAK